MQKSSLCDYSDALISARETISIRAKACDNKKFFQNCAPFSDCISVINKTQIDNAKDLDNANV